MAKTKTRPLTPRQQRFVKEYLIDTNASAAYKRAGYTATKGAAEANAIRMLKLPQVAAAVAKAQAASFERLDLKADDVLRELLRIATADIGGAFDARGNLRPVQDIPLELRRAIAGIEVVIKNAKAGDGIVDEVHKLKFWDKNRALETLAKHLGLLVEKVEHAGAVELSWKD